MFTQDSKDWTERKSTSTSALAAGGHRQFNNLSTHWALFVHEFEKMTFEYIQSEEPEDS
jgi:hypothetical protein